MNDQDTIALTTMQPSDLNTDTTDYIRKRSQEYCWDIVDELYKSGDEEIHGHYTRYQLRKHGWYYKIWNEDPDTRKEVLSDLKSCESQLRLMVAYNNYAMILFEEDTDAVSAFRNKYFKMMSVIINDIKDNLYKNQNIAKFFDNEIRDLLNSVLWKLEDAYFDYSRITTCMVLNSEDY